MYLFILFILFCILTVAILALLFPCLLMSIEKYIHMNIYVKSTKLNSLSLRVHGGYDSLKIGKEIFNIVWKYVWIEILRFSLENHV